MRLDKKIALLAFPLILSNITVPLLSLTNTFIAGHLQDATLMAATALGGLIINLIYWPFGFLRMSTVSWVAQARGAERPEDVTRTINHGVVIALFIGAVLIVLSPWLFNEVFVLLRGELRTEQFARAYLSIRIWSAPAVMLTTVLVGAFIGNQDTKTPFLMTVVTNVLAAALGLLLTQYYHFSLYGIAWADVVGQYVGLFIGLGILLRRTTISLFPMEWAFVRKLLAVNMDIFLRTCLMLSVYALFALASLHFGSSYLAANILILELLSLNTYLQDGFTNVAEALIGEQVGKNDPVSAIQSVWSTWHWMLLVALVMMVLALLFGRTAVNWMTNIDSVRQAVYPFLPMISLIPLISAPCFLFDGMFIGVGQFQAMRNTMLLSFLGYFTMWWVFARYHNWGLWLALVGFYVLRAVFMGGYFGWRHKAGRFFVGSKGAIVSSAAVE